MVLQSWSLVKCRYGSIHAGPEQEHWPHAYVGLVGVVQSFCTFFLSNFSFRKNTVKCTGVLRRPELWSQPYHKAGSSCQHVIPHPCPCFPSHLPVCAALWWNCTMQLRALLSAFRPVFCSSAAKVLLGTCYFTVLQTYLIFNFPKAVSKICQQITVELEGRGIISPIWVVLAHSKM